MRNRKENEDYAHVIQFISFFLSAIYLMFFCGHLTVDKFENDELFFLAISYSILFGEIS